MSIMNETQNVKQQFSNDKNLALRIDFYKKYTTNKYKFADWLFDKYDFKENMSRLTEKQVDEVIDNIIDNMLE